MREIDNAEDAMRRKGRKDLFMFGSQFNDPTPLSYLERDSNRCCSSRVRSAKLSQDRNSLHLQKPLRALRFIASFAL
jgi:hypothetical protein